MTPTGPIAAVLAVVVRDGAVLLVRRANPPDQGLWGCPGGRIERGETVFAAAERELKEETGIVGQADRLIEALDHLDHAPDGTLRHHFILLAVACRWTDGDPVAADDALEAAWIAPDTIADDDPGFSTGVSRLARQALASQDLARQAAT